MTVEKDGNNAILETIVDCLHPSNPTVEVHYSYQVLIFLSSILINERIA